MEKKQIESIPFVIKKLDCNKTGGSVRFQMMGIFEEAIEAFWRYFFDASAFSIVLPCHGNDYYFYSVGILVFWQKLKNGKKICWPLRVLDSNYFHYDKIRKIFLIPQEQKLDGIEKKNFDTKKSEVFTGPKQSNYFCIWEKMTETRAQYLFFLRDNFELGKKSTLISSVR